MSCTNNDTSNCFFLFMGVMGGQIGLTAKLRAYRLESQVRSNNGYRRRSLCLERKMLSRHSKSEGKVFWHEIMSIFFLVLLGVVIYLSLKEKRGGFE